jgi:hypothetical protein
MASYPRRKTDLEHQPSRRPRLEILDGPPTRTDQEVRSMREEVWVASPEPAVGVFTPAEPVKGACGVTS